MGHKKRSKNSIDFFNPFNVCIDLEYNNLVYYLVSNGEMEHIFDYIDIKDIYVRKYIIFYLLFPLNFFENLNEYVSDVKLYEVHVSKVLEMFGFKKRSD